MSEHIQKIAWEIMQKMNERRAAAAEKPHLYNIQGSRKFITPLLKKFRILRSKLFQMIVEHLVIYPTPTNLDYSWSFGALSGLCLVIQIISGILLAMHYTANAVMAFESVEHIMRDVNNGWLLRYIHANGASMFFIVVYIHIGRALYHSSYLFPREPVWISGVVIFLLMMATAFLGYVLPWGQMSLWGATVITNLFTAIPGVGQSIATWIWGGFSINSTTLTRFFTLHFFLPFIILAFSLIHIAFLHFKGSNNPVGTTSYDWTTFHPYFTSKDGFSFLSFLFIFSFFVFYYPNSLGHPDNYIPANPMVTPEHIVPEWYFLPFYAILRSIPNKLGGVACMVGALLVLFVLPRVFAFYRLNFAYFVQRVDTSRYNPIMDWSWHLLLLDVLLLGWVGSQLIEYPFVEIGQLATLYYFSYFLIPGLVEYFLLVKLDQRPTKFF